MRNWCREGIEGRRGRIRATEDITPHSPQKYPIRLVRLAATCPGARAGWFFGSDKDRLSLPISTQAGYPEPLTEASSPELAPQFSVVVDTCSFARPLTKGDPHHDAYLEAADVQLLLGDALPAGHTVCVPEIVVLEMVKHFREDLEVAVHDVDRHLRRAGEVLRLSVGIPAELVDQDAAVSRYEQWLRQHLVQDRRCLIQLIPAAARDGLHLIQRDLAGRRPFSEGGRGMRDTVLWLSVLELLGSSISNVALISANTKDFCADSNSSGQLHDDLLADLESRGWSGRVQHFASITSFADAHIKPVSERLDALRAELERGTHPTFDLHHTIVRAAGPILAAEPPPDVWIPRPRGAQLTLEAADVRDLHVNELYRVSADQYYIEGSTVLKATLRLVVPAAGVLDLLASSGYERTKPPAERRVPALNLQEFGSEGATGTVAIKRVVLFTLVMGPDGASGVTFELMGRSEERTRVE